MSKVIIVGTLAFDTIETPFGKVERVLGGSAPFASLASKTQNIDCAIISIVGNDFPKEYIDIFTQRNIDISQVQIDEKGKTFFWEGKYHDNMNKRDTLDTQVNVLEKFEPKLPEKYNEIDVLVLGNLDPKVQIKVIDQFSKRPDFTMLDTMNFWMNNSLYDLLEVIKKVDLICINDEEVLQLSNSKNINEGVSKILTMGPKYIIVKMGEYGASVYSSNNRFTCKSFPVKKVVDPTGAGDSFAGGFAGYLASSKDYGFESISNALIYANAIASFSVEKFGVDNMLKLQKNEINQRIEFIKKHNL
jgi:sugar/nucleoside kinase (ribokinase family)